MGLLRSANRVLLPIYAVLKAIVLLVGQLVFFFASVVAVKASASFRASRPRHASLPTAS